MILAGDIGGTKSNLALMEKKGDRFRVVFLHRYPSHEYMRFEDIIEDFLGRGRDFLSASAPGTIQAAGFGVAGPVIGRGVRITNLAWGIDADALERQQRASRSKPHNCTCDQKKLRLMGWGQPGQHHDPECPLFC